MFGFCLWLSYLQFPQSVVACLSKNPGRYLGLIIDGTGFTTLGFGLVIDLQPYKSLARIIIVQIITAIGLSPDLRPH